MAYRNGTYIAFHADGTPCPPSVCWGVMEPSALYEAPFSSVHAGGLEALFAGKSNVPSEKPWSALGPTPGPLFWAALYAAKRARPASASKRRR